MDAFLREEILAAQKASARPYFEFLRVPSLSMGIYVLPVGATDPQQPHGEDEVYYVLEGCGRITVGHENQAVAPGSLVYVPAGIVHRFHAITDTLKVLVFFAPAEGSIHRPNGP
jgi:quercetin dioxygenase-like cupin family protein